MCQWGNTSVQQRWFIRLINSERKKQCTIIIISCHQKQFMQKFVKSGSKHWVEMVSTDKSVLVSVELFTFLCIQ